MKKLIYAALAFAPIMALAQGTGAISTTNNSLTNLGTDFITLIKNIVIPALFALAIVYFFYGLAKFILAAGDAKKVAEGRGIMIWGIIAIAIMAALFGIVQFLTSAVGVTGTGSTSLPGGGSF